MMTIKTTLLTAALSFTAFLAAAQPTYNMGAVSGQTINTCSGTFVDAGGTTGNYGPNLNNTVTFCSGGGTNPTHIQISFGLFEISDDQICFYDGPNTAAPQTTCLGGTTGQPVPGGPFLVRASAANTSGCITVSFTSNGSGQDNGWVGNVSCVASCQTIYSELTSSTPAVNPLPNGYIDICKGQNVLFSGTGVYPQSGIVYNHSNSTSTFEWDFGDGQTGVGINTSHVYDQPGGYFVQLSIRDQFNCPNVNNLSQRVRVSGPPRFTGTGSSLLQPVCAGDTTPITAVVGNVTSQTQVFSTPLVSGDSLFLPDGAGTSYSTAINVQSFSPGQTITSLNDLLGICVNMEHSYMGDLTIRIRCPAPSNTTVYLQGSATGGGSGASRWLGTPCDIDNLPNVRGIPAQYCWTPSATQTWLNGPTTNVTQNCPPNTSSASLNAGNYAPANSLSALIGCPLNGQWTLTFVDNLSIDNGYLTSWGLNFASNLYPTVESFTPTIVTANWAVDPTIVSAAGQNISVSSTTAGAHYYKYTVTNNFGCTYDTVVTVNILPENSPTCRTCNGFAAANMRDTTICLGNAVTLDATSTGGLGSIITKFGNNLKRPIPNGSSTNQPASTTAPYLYSDVTVSSVVPTTIAASSIDRVCINFTQSYDGDLDVYLISPTGTRIVLTDDNGAGGQNYGTLSSTGIPLLYTCFIPTATQTIVQGALGAPFTNPAGYLPEGSFAAFNGQNPNGVWRLKYGDDSGSPTVASGAQFNDWYIAFRNDYKTTYNWARSPNTGTFVPANGAAIETATPIATTTYTVTATDTYGCTDTENVVVTTGNSIPAPVVTCDAVTTSSVTFAWTSVTPTHQVSLDNGVTWITPSSGAAGSTHTVSGLATGQSVTLCVRGIGNCPALFACETCTAQGCNLLLTTPTLSTVSCFGLANGTANVPQTNGLSPLHWDLAGPVNATNQSVGTFNNLLVGSYTVTLTDDRGCTKTITFSMTEPTALTATTTNTDVLCFGGNTGASIVNPTGGTPPYTYSWLTPAVQTTQSVSSLVANAYIVTVTDSKSCSHTATATINEPLSGITPSLTMTQPTCNGSTNGSATVSVSGGASPYTYRWSSIPQQVGATATNLPGGNYTIIITDANGCSRVGSIAVTQLSTVDAGMQITNVTCFGLNNGDINVNATGGNPPYTFAWSMGGAATISRSNLLAGTYSVTVTDQSGCATSTSGVVLQPAAVSGIATQIDSVSCNAQADGKVNLVVSGGTAPYTYNWGNSIIIQNPTTFAAGTHTVTITDSNSCVGITSVVVLEPAILTVPTPQTTPVTCFGDANGRATIVPAGGTSPYRYLWSQASFIGANPTNLPAGTHSVTITDYNGCATSTTVTITEPPRLTVTVAPTDSVSCFGGGDGKALATANGGTPNYSYQWDIPNASATHNGLTAGVHTVTVTDGNTCVTSATVTILQPLQVAVSFSQIDSVSCNGISDGKACATATNGTAPYRYRWDDNSTASCNTNLLVGLHFVTVTDLNGCTATASLTILQPAPLTALAVQADSVSCNGGSDGKATVTVSGGTQPYRYRWDINTITIQNPTTLPAGTHTVTVTDFNLCTYSTEVIIREPALLTATATQTDSVSCYIGSDGKACVLPVGGTLPYRFVWDNGITTTCNITLTAGIHTVTVTDLNGCTTSTTVTILRPDILGAFANEVRGVTCFGRSDGQGTLTASGGTMPYNYRWDNQNTALSPIDLTSGTHTVLVTDVNGCTVVATTSISTPPLLTASASRIDSVRCNGGATGSAIVTAVGGTPAYTYAWDNSSSLNNPINLTEGLHTVLVTDNNTCTTIASVTILEPSALSATAAQADSVSCNGLSDGSATVTPTGGTPPYRYSWTNGSNLQTPTNFAAGPQTCTVTDYHNCQTTATVTIAQPAILTATATQTDSVSCNGGNDGKAQVAVFGGTQPYRFAWSGSVSTTSSATDLTQGTHTVTITDVNGCNTTTTVFITEPLPLFANATATNANCFAASDGSATVTPVGGTPPYRYAWSAPSNATTPTAPNLRANTYTVTVIDYNVCTATAIATVGEPTALQTTLTPTNILCNGNATGSIASNTSGATPAYTYRWSGQSAQQSPIATGLRAGTYTVTITDSRSCILISSATVTEPSPLQATATGTNLSCNNNPTGTANVNVQGGTPPYTFNWTGGLPQQGITGLAAGTYNCTVTDANNCSISAQVVISEPAPLLVSLTKTDAVCFGQPSGSANSSVTGGTSGYTYTWAGSSSVTPNLVGLTAGTYTVQVLDANSCTASASITLGQPADIDLTLTQQPVRCFGLNSGQATVIAGGGIPGYSYQWATVPIQVNSTATLLRAGDVTVAVTDAAGCTKIAQIQVVEPERITIELAITPVRCNGETSGRITATVSGGVTGVGGGYGYYWSDRANQNTPTATNLEAGVYTVTVNDANACVQTAVGTVATINPIVVIPSATPVVCFGENNGTATVTASGGEGILTYAWNTRPGAVTTATATQLIAGVYNVTVTDERGCTIATSATVTQPSKVLASVLTISPVNCKNFCDGAATVVGAGGISPYQYKWLALNNEEQPTVTGRCAGTYYCEVTDVNGCKNTAPAIITEPQEVVRATATATEAGCQAAATGTATVSATGGTVTATATYTYQWSGAGNQTGATATGLVAGIYTVIVTDTKGCTAMATVTVRQPSGLTVIFPTKTIPSCTGGKDASATAVASGGTPNYTYTWSTIPTQTGSLANGLQGSQIYTVTATDINGCTGSSTTAIAEPLPIVLSISSIPAGCFAGATGSATVLANGGSPTYYYAWSNSPSTAALADNLVAGVYNVTVTDQKGCSAATNTTIIQSSRINLRTIAQGAACFGETTGVASVIATGGSPNYTYIWSNDPTNKTPTAPNLTAGIYTVTVSDVNICTTTAQIQITEPPLLTMTAVPTDSKCYGSFDGQINIQPQGGQSPYVYSYNNGQSFSGNPILVGLRAKEYKLAVRDANGCTARDTVLLNEPVELLVDAGSDKSREFGDTVRLTAIASGGTGALNYVWKTTPTDTTILVTATKSIVANPQSNTYYKVVVTDVNGCSASDQVLVNITATRRVFVATAITPNNDNINDVLYVQGGRGTERVTYLRVYDRWGELVFETKDAPVNDPRFGWDGTYKGQQMDSSTFVWTTEVRYTDGQKQVLKGDVSLLR